MLWRATWPWSICILCTLILLWIVWRWWCRSAEGFAEQEYTQLNAQYTAKEAFLVAPLGVSDYSEGYDTKAKAVEKCQEFGATLATSAQLTSAIQLGARWCWAGWYDDGSATGAAASVQDANCTASKVPGFVATQGAPPLTATPQKIAKPATVLTPYAICWGVKPQMNSSPLVQPFNTTSYSMINETLLGAVMNGTIVEGTPSDIFPVTFTASQAMYALENHGGGRYDAATARKYLIDNYATVNDTIATAVNTQTGAYDVSGDWLNTSKGKETPCSYLETMYSDFALKLTCLRSQFADVSGGLQVSAAIRMKNESGSMQGIIAAACANETPSSSPACARLAGLDYSSYYGTGAPPIINDLRDLNYALAMREQEMQQAISTLLKLMSVIGCYNSQPQTAAPAAGSGAAAPTGAAAPSNTPPATLLQKTCPGTGNKVTVDMGILGGNTEATKFNIQTNIGYNSVESLKLSLEEISPYFTSPAYNAITQQVLGTLSGLLRLPSPERFNGYVDTMKGATTKFGTIKDLVPALV